MYNVKSKIKILLTTVSGCRLIDALLYTSAKKNFYD